MTKLERKNRQLEKFSLRIFTLLNTLLARATTAWASTTTMLECACTIINNRLRIVLPVPGTFTVWYTLWFVLYKLAISDLAKRSEITLTYIYNLGQENHAIVTVFIVSLICIQSSKLCLNFEFRIESSWHFVLFFVYRRLTWLGICIWLVCFIIICKQKFISMAVRVYKLIRIVGSIKSLAQASALSFLVAF